TVSVINQMPKAEIEEKLKSYTFAEKKEEKKGLTLPDAQRGKVVTRFPPEPSGYPHIGHAKAALLDYEAARVYDGKFLLRFDDTNPEKESQAFADAIKEGLAWLGVKWDAETYVSDSIPKLYAYAEKMLEAGDLYVCECKPEEMKANRASGEACACRSRGAKENLALWDRLKQGEVHERKLIVRFKGDMKAVNTVMRDPTMFRIIEKKHYRQGNKYSLWPMYDFDAPIIDSLEGVTHAMRTKEYELRDELYYAILDALGMRKPILVEFARLQIKNAPISKRLITPLIERKEVSGWDDPRLPTLAALRRRGIFPDAIRAFVLSFGLAKTESMPGWGALLAENKKMLDPVAPRYFFVPEPVKLTVKGAPEKEAKLHRHPADEKMGFRSMTGGSQLFIAKADADLLKVGEVFRLKDLFNVKVEAVNAGEISGSYAGDAPGPDKKVQWVNEQGIRASVMVPGDLLLENGEFNPYSMRVDQGLVEPDAAKLEQGDRLQFERYGFCRLDDKKSMRFIFISP
ncbi:MAG: glutamate--tRNA ligase, partial [Candidatus Micrarchaeia archaeon]